MSWLTMSVTATGAMSRMARVQTQKAWESFRKDVFGRAQASVAGGLWLPLVDLSSSGNHTHANLGLLAIINTILQVNYIITF